jgi:hypothetical protein
MLNILSHREMKSNLLWDAILYQSDWSRSKKRNGSTLPRMGDKEKTHQLRVGVPVCRATLEITVAVRQENRNQSSSQSSCIILGNIPKGSYIFSSVVCIAVLSHNSGGKQLRCSSRGKWIQKICHIDTMECYLIFKNSKFSGK